MTATLINVIDIEATCWQDRVPPEGQVSEIIEIGLTVLDPYIGERLAKHRILVKPERSEVSAFCTSLTGLTQQEVDGGVPFAEACAALAGTWAAGVRPWASWGDYDRTKFSAQCRETSVPYPFGPVHVNAKKYFADRRGLRKQVGMARALKIAGLPLEGRHHSGADDSWNIAALIMDTAGGRLGDSDPLNLLVKGAFSG